MSATPDGTLANLEQRIADLERQLAEREAELAECKTERDEAQQRETATAEVLDVINSSPGALGPVFDAILETARAACGFEQGSVTVFDGEYFRTIAMHGIPETFANVLRQPRRAGPQTLFLDGGRIVHIPDFAAEAPAVGDNRVYRAAVAAGVRTVLFVPLRSGQRLLGYITAYRQEVCPFSDKQIALLQNFAAQAVIAMENARLITETREVLEQQTAIADVLRVINSSRGDLAPVFDAILQKALNLCAATCGGLQSYDGRYFHQLVMRGPQEIEEWGRGLGPIDPEPGTTIAEIVQGRGVVQVADMMKSKAYRNETSSGRRALVDIGGFQTILSIALRKDGVLRGALHLWRSEVQPFSDKQIALLENFAAQAVIAMENARLLDELRQLTDEVAEQNRRLEAQVAGQTRKRIGPRGSAEAISCRRPRRKENP